MGVIKINGDANVTTHRGSGKFNEILIDTPDDLDCNKIQRADGGITLVCKKKEDGNSTQSIQG